VNTVPELISQLKKGNKKALARCISIVENEMPGYEELLSKLELNNNIPIIGITGAPGAGKSTLINSLLKKLTDTQKKVGVIAVDPTSPFTLGSILGDRIRMEEHFINENVFIRSLATRGSLGGLSAKTIEVSDVMKCFEFDYIIIETVGVGQSEVEIMGLADTTVLILVPEGGDEVQTIKSGIMEIADVFVVNKCDREGADRFVKNIHQLLHEKAANEWTPPVIKAIATNDTGTEELIEKITEHGKNSSKTRRLFLLAEKAYRLIQSEKMKNIIKSDLKNDIEQAFINTPNFNIYRFTRNYSQK